ncbi:putative fibroblast growth factor1 [Porites harrisoni]
MTSMKVLLYSRWGYFLQIDGQQRIRGVRTRDDYCDLELKTVDFGKVTIRGEKTKAYVAVNAQGELCVAESTNPSCVWTEIQHLDGYNYYQSDLHSKFYMGLKRIGVPKNGDKSGLGQVGCGFLSKPIT